MELFLFLARVYKKLDGYGVSSSRDDSVVPVIINLSRMQRKTSLTQKCDQMGQKSGQRCRQPRQNFVHHVLACLSL